MTHQKIHNLNNRFRRAHKRIAEIRVQLLETKIVTPDEWGQLPQTIQDKLRADAVQNWSRKTAELRRHINRLLERARELWEILCPRDVPNGEIEHGTICLKIT